MNLQSYNDQDLVKVYITGNENGLQELLRRHKSKIYTSIYLLVKDQYLAEDIFQDAFIKVINTLRSGRYNEEGKFLPWVMRIAHNLVIDYFRKEKRTPIITSADGMDVFNMLHFYDESAEDKMLRDQTHKDLKAMIHFEVKKSWPDYHLHFSTEIDKDIINIAIRQLNEFLREQHF